MSEPAPETPLESQRITVFCRANHGLDGAWDEAVARLREVYVAQVIRDTSVTLTLSISRVRSPKSA